MVLSQIAKELQANCKSIREKDLLYTRVDT